MTPALAKPLADSPVLLNVFTQPLEQPVYLQGKPMQNFEFYNPTKIVFGDQTIARLADLVPRSAC